jgi:phage replication O-like protein O
MPRSVLNIRGWGPLGSQPLIFERKIMPYGDGNPQLEDGFTRIANEILEALARTNLMDSESRCIHYLWRKTYGWHSKGNAQAKKTDIISYGQWVSGTGLERTNAKRALSQLVDRHIITKEVKDRPGKNSITIWGFQKKYTEWNGYHPLQYRLQLGAGQPPLRNEPVVSQPPVPSQVGAGQPPLTNEVGVGGRKVGAGEPPEVGAGQPPTIDNKDNTIDNTLSKEKGVKKEKSVYGVGNNVYLTDQEYRKLVGQFGEPGALQRIDVLSAAIGSKGYKYKSHYLTILHWESMDKGKEKSSAEKKGKYPGKPRPGTIATSKELDEWEK